MLLVRRYAPDGAQTDQVLEGAITIGRATDNAIQLPGLLVALHHARLTPTSGVGLHLECPSAVGVTVNGAIGQRTADLLPGDELGIGGHRVRVGIDDRGAAALEIHERDPDAQGATTAAVTTLAEAGWRLRRPALVGAGVVLLLFLIVPVVLRALSVPDRVGDFAPTDGLWSSGRVSDAHQHFAQQCTACHDRPFVQVRDESCLSCHQGIAQHGDDVEAIHAAGLDAQRCASCHYEHGGTKAILPQHPALCADCHAEPSRFPNLAPDAVATDFASAHPAFRVRVTHKAATGRQTLREPLSAEVKDESGLIYPHDLHLDPRGVRGPDGAEVLQCATCHRPGIGDVGFQPLNFERDCQRCHQLDVDVGGLPFRLPHGDTEAVRGLLQSAVGMAPIAPVAEPTGTDAGRRRPGANADRGDGSQGPGQVDDVFERRVCAKCHEVDRNAEGRPTVLSPALRKTWMPMARFSHAPHQWVSCDSCHAATVSDDSNDLLLPQIETCRACHGGVGSSGGIQSTCIDCHRFHQAAETTMGKLTGKLANGQTLEGGG